MDSEDTGIEKTIRLYEVPFIIWANYDIAEEDNVSTGANMLGPYLLQKIGLRMTGYDKYLLNLRDEIPVIASAGFIDKSGKLYPMNRDSVGEQAHGDRLLEYQKIEYYNIKEKKRNKEFFYLK